MAGAEGHAHAPAELRLRDATFGDWLEFGDIERQTVVNPRSTGGDSAVEFKVNPATVAHYIEALSGEPASVIHKLPFQTGRKLYLDLMRKVPAFDQARSDGDGVHRLPDGSFEVALRTPLPGAREQTKAVIVRQPDLGDWIECGDLNVQRALNPGQDNEPESLEVKLDESAVGRWMQRLTGLPFPILAAMDYHDARRVFAVFKPLLAGQQLGNF